MAAKELSAAVLAARARAKTLSIEERRASLKLSFSARRALYRSDGSMPKATHRGVLELGDARIPCAVLSDGTRLLSQRGVGEALGRKRGGRDWTPADPEESGTGGRLPFFMGA
jgi:hypothetical protein